MDKYSYDLIGGIILFMSLLWTGYTILSPMGTACFNMVYVYITIFALYLEVIWANWVKPSKEE